MDALSLLELGFYLQLNCYTWSTYIIVLINHPTWDYKVSSLPAKYDTRCGNISRYNAG